MTTIYVYELDYNYRIVRPNGVSKVVNRSSLDSELGYLARHYKDVRVIVKEAGG